MIQGREVRLPVEVRDATAAVAYYLVPASAAQRLIEHSGLRVVQVLPGRRFPDLLTRDSTLLAQCYAYPGAPEP